MKPLLGVSAGGSAFETSLLPWLPVGAGWWLRPQPGLAGGIPISNLSLWLLGFFTVCPVDPKTECSETQEVKSGLLKTLAKTQLSLKSLVFYCADVTKQIL